MGTRMVAQGALTTRVLSIGRDRPWPYGLTKQLDPEDPGFLPRALLPVHVNLFYRNWTTIGLPGWADEAIVDPGGWLTPFRDGPSIAVWVGDSRRLYPLGPMPGWGSDVPSGLRQERIEDLPIVRTQALREDIHVELDAFPAVVNGNLVFGLTTRVWTQAPAMRPIRIAIAIRPANPEGVSPIFDIERTEAGLWNVNNEPFLYVPRQGDEQHMCTWKEGDVYAFSGGVLRDGLQRTGVLESKTQVACEQGLATACEIYRVNLSPGDRFKRTVYALRDPAVGEVLRRSSATRLFAGVKADYRGLIRAGAYMDLPVHPSLFSSSRTTLLSLCDTYEVTPGPATYHSFFFRDAAFLLAALNRLGFGRRAAEILKTYPSRQSRSGAWLSQGGEWDGTGQGIWSVMDHVRLTGNRRLLAQLYPSIAKAASWIIETQEDGLMPSGWSAEHLGPADQYYWDSIWSCSGLKNAATAASMLNKSRDAERFMRAHGQMLERLRAFFGEGPIPAAPGRQMDSAAVSALCAIWPLNLFSAKEPSLQSTMQWLDRYCVQGNAFFHDVVHSGINPYLTCHLAQAKLAGEQSGAPLHLDALAEGASPTGCWPEAYLPGRGGVMGDGDHAWAAAEFAMLQRNMILCEEGGVLHLFRGTDRRWWDARTELRDAPTKFGHVDLVMEDAVLTISGRWREKPNRVIWHKPDGERGTLVLDGRKKSAKAAQIAL